MSILTINLKPVVKKLKFLLFSCLTCVMSSPTSLNQIEKHKLLGFCHYVFNIKCKLSLCKAFFLYIFVKVIRPTLHFCWLQYGSRRLHFWGVLMQFVVVCRVGVEWSVGSWEFVTGVIRGHWCVAGASFFCTAITPNFEDSRARGIALC
uniref:Putative secreted protein n=1 Tax=Ixodes ricinus TaxID=34613 RepID=A0A6B0UUT2_IXORI